jgi:mannonate dehydratase
VWTDAEIEKHQAHVAQYSRPEAPLRWSVVESVPVSDAIKVGSAEAGAHIAAYKDTLRNLAKAGIKTICYNFMPLLDWTRTDLDFALANGAKALRFDATAFAAFDLFILNRDGAADDYDADRIKSAETYFQSLSPDEAEAISLNIVAGLPGGTSGGHTLESFKAQLAQYKGISSADLFDHFVSFLREVTPVAEELGMRMAVHPDDPPRPLLGLPRIVSTAADLEALFKAVPSEANGLTFCTGSFGVRADNDLVAMAQTYAERIYFAHLRGTVREQDAESFFEGNHLQSDVDMPGVITQLLNEETRRKKAGFADFAEIPFRPDHGHQMLDDLDKQGVNAGYTAIGRLKGLAELRGVIAGIDHSRSFGAR